MRLPTLVALTALALVQGPPSATAPRVPALGPRIEQRVERFLLERRTVDEHGHAHTDVAGFVEWRRRDDEAGPQLECDTRFLRHGAGVDSAHAVERVHQVECLTGRGPRCQWREIGGAGRSVQAEWSDDGGALDIVEWSPAGKKRGTLVASDGVSMPLYLAELVRAGRITAGPVTRFDPLARTLEPLTVRTVWLAGNTTQVPADTSPCSGTSPEAGAAPMLPTTTPAESSQPVRECEAPPVKVQDQRTVELLRPDGTLAARYVFAGLELVSFQWQEGGLVARAVDEATFESLAAQDLPIPVPASGRRARR